MMIIMIMMIMMIMMITLDYKFSYILQNFKNHHNYKEYTTSISRKDLVIPLAKRFIIMNSFGVMFARYFSYIVYISTKQ